MRLGRHPAFTRIVFELDAPVGYSLERTALAAGGSELVVTLDASATDREMSLGKSLVAGVQLSGIGQRSVARIRLSDGGLRIKEMILGSPPRIVLDVLAPKPVKSAKVPAPKSTAKTPASAVSKPVAATPKPAVTRSTQPKVEPVQPVASISRGKAATPTRVATRPKAVPAAQPTAKPGAIASAKPRLARTNERPKATPRAATRPSKPAKTPPPPARKKPVARKGTLPAAPAAIPQASSDSLFTPINIGGGLALLGLVGGGVVFMQRRRAGVELLGEDDFEKDPLSADNPFASLGDEFSVAPEPAPSDESAEIPVAQHVDDSTDDADDVADADVVDEFAADDDSDIPVAKVSVDAEPQEDLFDTSMTEALGADDTDTLGAESTETAGDDMETYGDSAINTGMDAAPPIPGAGMDDSSEVMRMLREFEQRVSSLESRLDEVSEAKERLERQVAAQTEELRVQRAAIARTQRALRNLSRTDEESPTEPALRDPNA